MILLHARCLPNSSRNITSEINLQPPESLNGCVSSIVVNSQAFLLKKTSLEVVLWSNSKREAILRALGHVPASGPHLCNTILSRSCASRASAVGEATDSFALAFLALDGLTHLQVHLLKRRLSGHHHYNPIVFRHLRRRSLHRRSKQMNLFYAKLQDK